MIVLAHASHWLLPVLYATPIVVVVSLLAVAVVRDRRSGRAEGRTSSSGTASTDA